MKPVTLSGLVVGLTGALLAVPSTPAAGTARPLAAATTASPRHCSGQQRIDVPRAEEQKAACLDDLTGWSLAATPTR